MPPQPAARLVQRYCDSGTCVALENSTRGLDSARLGRVLNFIEANIKNDITLEELASIASYSAFHFARKFTVSMGIAPHRYISQIRLQIAMAELAASKLPLAEIAFNAHFSSQASFTRAFRRATGMTPMEFRRCPKLISAGWRHVARPVSGSHRMWNDDEIVS
jgi:AraC family transcriptional regulator